MRNINDQYTTTNCDYEISMRNRDKNWSLTLLTLSGGPHLIETSSLKQIDGLAFIWKGPPSWKSQKQWSNLIWIWLCHMLRQISKIATPFITEDWC